MNPTQCSRGGAGARATKGGGSCYGNMAKADLKLSEEEEAIGRSFVGITAQSDSGWEENPGVQSSTSDT
jgi:hypothetical protein